MNSRRYTLWTIPQSEWTQLPNMEITPEITKELKRALKNYGRTELDRRLAPYNTKVLPETMFKIVP